jgi:DNA-binding response OmpR family regulator
MGANYYMVKPADPAKIVDAVKNMLEEPAPGAIK